MVVITFVENLGVVVGSLYVGFFCSSVDNDVHKTCDIKRSNWKVHRE